MDQQEAVKSKRQRKEVSYPILKLSTSCKAEEADTVLILIDELRE